MQTSTIGETADPSYHVRRYSYTGSSKEQAQRIDQAMGQPLTEPKAASVRKKQARLKEACIPLRKSTPTRSALEIEMNPAPVVREDAGRGEEPDTAPSMSRWSEGDKNAGEGQKEETIPVTVVPTPHVKTQPVRIQPKVIESYHSLLHPQRQWFLAQQAAKEEGEDAEDPEYGIEVQDDSTTDLVPQTAYPEERDEEEEGKEEEEPVEEVPLQSGLKNVRVLAAPKVTPDHPPHLFPLPTLAAFIGARGSWCVVLFSFVLVPPALVTDVRVQQNLCGHPSCS
jgi:hypothetical protein